MDWSGSIRIQSEAAEALAEWKAFFAKHVAVKAKELAQNSNPPGLITLDHYRQAAVLMPQSCAPDNVAHVLSDETTRAFARCPKPTDLCVGNRPLFKRNTHSPNCSQNLARFRS